MWRVWGAFGRGRYEALQERVCWLQQHVEIEQIIILAQKEYPLLYPSKAKFFNLGFLSNKKGLNAPILQRLVNHRTLLIIDNCEMIFNYPQSTTRNLINFVSPHVLYKIIMGEHYVGKHMSDLYAPFATLDKAILFANHYWCFAEDHLEESVFDRHIIANKDPAYCAEKVRPFIYAEVSPSNEVQEQLYAHRSGISRERLHDIAHLEVG